MSEVERVYLGGMDRHTLAVYLQDDDEVIPREGVDEVPVAVLPIATDGAVGPLELWMVKWLLSGNIGIVPKGCHPAGVTISNAIAKILIVGTEPTND